MATVWAILSRTIFYARLIQSSKDHGVSEISIPLEISADFIPEMLRERDSRLIRLMQGLSPDAPEFDDIIHESEPMKRVVARARRVAPYSYPVLILGETGVGKELFAKAIHNASPRHSHPFVCVNCAAIPASLTESELFGHKEGAFTDAKSDKKGKVEEADKGTL
ncbi:MAG TPA: AAA family ATPase, partial [Firmicutes bacterium]|nr:AAA family ATPase [Bacillota bacterium]